MRIDVPRTYAMRVAAMPRCARDPALDFVRDAMDAHAPIAAEPGAGSANSLTFMTAPPRRRAARRAARSATGVI